MTSRATLLASIASTIADYRAGDISAPTADHVERWAGQFDEDVQLPLLSEIDHVLERTYFARADVDGFLHSLVNSQKLAGEDPRAYWKTVRFLDIQDAGRSQKEMLGLFGAALEEVHELPIAECGDDSGAFVYLDDAIFSGNRILADLRGWIESEAPTKARVEVVCMALHRGGHWYASSKLAEAAKQAGKAVELGWWRGVEIEDRKAYISASDVLRPTEIPNDERTRAYAESLAYEPVLRTPGGVGDCAFFSSNEGRHLLEQELLKAGVRIRDMCPYLNDYQRPLGNMVLQTLGFGTLVVTFRNCPNNAPLALWAGDPWYPLFPRKTN